MKVKELKKILNKLNDEDLVVISKDSEGNSYSPLDDYFLGLYIERTTWYGDVYLRCNNDDFKGVNAVILVPVN